MRLIHVASDEKFINSAYWQFNQAFPNQNRFYLLVDDPGRKLQHVSINEHFQLVPKRIEEVRKLAGSAKDSDIFCFHGLDYLRSVFLNALPSTCTTVWFLWGMEVYNKSNLVANREVLGPLTVSKFNSNTSGSSIIQFFDDTYEQLRYKIKKRTSRPPLELIKAMKKADYMGILYQEEFAFIKSKINTDLKFIKFSYYPIELMVKDETARVHSNHILIGNSARETNNHLEVFQLLESLSIEGRKLIVPLSYGEPEYRDVIIETGNNLFGQDFCPLVDFMPLHEYNTLLEQCGIVIMNHYRQQALGNILTMLWMGAKVYLDERNTIYHYLLRIGVKIFSIQTDLNKNNADVLTPLHPEEQDANRRILKAEIGQEFLIKELRNHFAALSL